MAVARTPLPCTGLANFQTPFIDIDSGTGSDMQPLSLCVVGADGALRLLDVDAAIGNGVGAGQVGE